MAQRTCRECGAEKDEEDFPKDGHGGRHLDCRVCFNAKRRKRYAEDPEYREARLAEVKAAREADLEGSRARGRQSYYNHREARLAYAKERHAADPEPGRLRAREWNAENPERMRARSNAHAEANRAAYALKARLWYEANRLRAIANAEARRALVRDRTVGEVDLQAILDEHGMVCHICTYAIENLRSLHFDHVIPLARGGEHSMDNLLPAHAICNRRKHKRLMSELPPLEIRRTWARPKAVAA